MPQATQTINGRQYVYRYRSVWNKEKKRSEQKREYIGRIIDGQFVPNKRYRLEMELAERQPSEPEPPKPAPVPAPACRRLFAGATHLLDQIGQKTGLDQDLRACFPNIHEEIRSLAYYLALEPTAPLYRFKRWAVSHEHPLGKDLPSQRSSELLALITEERKMDFLRRQARRSAGQEYLFYDSTSISSYSEQLKMLKYGHNKDGDHLPQLNLALLFGQSSGLPVYYRKLPGNINDVMTIGNLLAGVDYLNLKKVRLVMDRGFYSEDNVNKLFQKHYKFILGARISLKFIQRELEPERANFDRRENYCSEVGLFMKTKTVDWPYEEKRPRSGEVLKEKRRLYVHIYYNDQSATDDKLRFNKMLDAMEEDLRSAQKLTPEREKACAKYYETTLTRGGLKLKPRPEAIAEARKNYGFFVLLSNSLKDPLEALRVYRSKDMVEKAFADLKDRLNLRRTSVSSEENLEGKIFIQFIALIYLSYLKKAMDQAKLFKNYTIQEVFDELDVIEKYQQPGKAPYYSEITAKQKKLYEALALNQPA